jgi:ADP-ribose pyrophosphatase YjhB (NUDIX family)
MSHKGYIPPNLYSSMHAILALPTIDVVILQRGKALLLRRIREPAKDQLWFPGGRLFKNEAFEDAARRLALGEAGIAVAKLEFLGIDNLIFPTDPFNHGLGTHMVSLLFRCRPAKPEIPVSCDENHAGYVWSAGEEPFLSEHVSRFIKKALSSDETKQIPSVSKGDN